MEHSTIEAQFNLLINFANKDNVKIHRVVVERGVVFMYLDENAQEMPEGDKIYPYITEASISEDWNEVAYESTWDRSRN